MRDFIVGTVLILLLMAGMVTTAFAHDAVLIRSTPGNGDVLPETPSEVMAWFEEELISGESSITVFNAEGKQVDNGDGGVNLDDPDHASLIVTLPPLDDGSYTVQWHVTLVDGDTSDGAFAFAVGEGQTVISATAPEVPAEEGRGGLSTTILVAVVAGLLVLLFIGGLAVRRGKS